MAAALLRASTRAERNEPTVMGDDLGVRQVDGWRLFMHSQNETSARLIPAIQVGHTRELLKREALGLELAPLGYYLKDDELADHVDIDRDPDGGRRTGDVETDPASRGDC